MKSVWLSVLDVPEQTVQAMMANLKRYGLECSGHQWTDDAKNMAWMGPKASLVEPRTAFWAIMGSKDALLKPETRYGLSLLALCVQAQRGKGFPMVVLQTDDPLLTVEELPTALQRSIILPAADTGTPAKLVAKAHARPPALPEPYRLDMVGDPQLGQWFEVHPTHGSWQGIIFGIDEGEIRFQAVGPTGALPKTSTLNYPMQGLKIEFKQTDFVAWAVRNELSIEMSYFVKIDGFPSTFLFGAFSDASETEMYHIRLK